MDHETSGAEEWLLPGYGHKALKSRTSNPRLVDNERRDPPSTPLQYRVQTTQQPFIPTNPAAPDAGNHVSNNTRGMTRPSRARSGYRGRQSYPRARHANNPFRDSPSKSRWRSGSEPTCTVSLPAPFGWFKHEFFRLARASLSGGTQSRTQARDEVLEHISQRTGAFIKPPSYTDQAISLWGEASQVASAKDLLESLIASCSSYLRQNKKAEWPKINAHSANKEANFDLKETQDTLLTLLRKEPDSISRFPEQLLFLWPKEGPSLEKALGSQLDALDLIRLKFCCHVFVPKSLPGYICVLGEHHGTIKQIAHCLRTKWSEIIAISGGIRSKTYLVEPPDPSSMKTKVVVKQSHPFATALLRGDRLKGTRLEHWRGRSTLIQSKNNARLLKALESSLRAVAVVRGHLRMRANFGSFVLDRYHAPEDSKPSYEFEEFREMLLYEGTKGRLIPGLKTGHDELLARCFEATDLLEPYESISTSLKDVELAYSVNFEFLGSSHSMLRLEAEFAKSPGAQDYEITQRRWLKFRRSGQSSDGQPPLQIGVIDFRRSDWQLEIKSLEFNEASTIASGLRQFSHSISFKRNTSVGDISAGPQRKVMFPDTAPVSRFVEKTAIRYRLKGTEYTLEIARYDEYSRTAIPAFQGQNPATVTGGISNVPSTSWGASVFASSWDNLLGEHANLPVGQSARYKSNLSTFFPSKGSVASDEKNLGFWEFIDLVKKVAELLGPTRISQTPQDTSSGKPPLSFAASVATRSQPSSNESSPRLGVRDPSGLLQSDLGTLF